MDECRECEGAYIECMDYNGTIYQCPRCGDLTNQWGKKINDRKTTRRVSNMRK